MRKFAQLLSLDIKRLFKQPSALLLFFVLPLLLTIPAGEAAQSNDESLVLPAFVDLAQNPDSRSLAAALLDSRIPWQEMTLREGELALSQDEIHALVKIPRNFKLDGSKPLVLAAGSKAESFMLVLEETSIAFSGKLTEDRLIQNLLPYSSMSRYELVEEFNRRVEERIAASGHIKLEAQGIPEEKLDKQELLMLPSYNMELLFLSLFAILALFNLENVAKRERLRRSYRNYLLDGISRYTALLIIGAGEIVALNLLSSSLQGSPSPPVETYVILFVFLAGQITLAFIFSLIPENMRLLGAILFTFISAALGGCFIGLPGNILRQTANFSPHAWAMASLSGVHLLGPGAVLGLALLVAWLAHTLKYYSSEQA